MPALILASSSSNAVPEDEAGFTPFWEHDDKASAAAPATAPLSTVRRVTGDGVTVAEA